jgi:hydrogenase expression/formation protein HypE
MIQEFPSIQGPVCPLPLPHHDQILLGHGSGGKMSHDLISRVFMPPFDNPSLRAGDDAGVVQIIMEDSTGKPAVGRLAISTDSHVVWPLFFPGGDIGRLAICGTVNDVAMMGAQPLFLSAGFVIEEGFKVDKLSTIVASMQSASHEAGIQIVAGDTKVVQKGKADGLFINTTGVGLIPSNIEIGGAQAKPGDVVILSGSIGDHGIAVLAARGDLGFEAEIQSDVAPLNYLVQSMLKSSQRIHVLRDPTRGGLATSLNEIARQSGVGIVIEGESIPVKPAVATACELLGFDPLYIANEGKLIAILPEEEADTVLGAMRQTRYGEEAVIIGEVKDDPKGRVLLKTAIGSTRVVDVPSGEILPRIC